MTTAFPLTWPPTIPRSAKREKGAFKTSLAGARHPDKEGGSHAAMAELNAAYERAQQEIGQ